MRALVLYYSNSGHTRQVAADLAADLDAELGEITCATYLHRYGRFMMYWDMFTRRRPRVLMLTPPAAHYDLVVIGGPVWAGRIAPPIMSMLASHSQEMGRVGLFVTCNGTHADYGPAPALNDMAAELSRPPIATAIFKEADIASGAYRQPLAAFAQDLRNALA